MGYQTDFDGRIELEPALTSAQWDYLRRFSETRRMKRNPDIASSLDDPARKAVGLPIGTDGAYFVNGRGSCGQGDDPSIVGFNEPPGGQPGLWCQWIPTDDGKYIEWDRNEKFYDYVDWMKYIITHFLDRWGIVANGTIAWRGEEFYDTGYIIVKDNHVHSVSR